MADATAGMLDAGLRMLDGVHGAISSVGSARRRPQAN
jgi:hypothetical protein